MKSLSPSLLSRPMLAVQGPAALASLVITELSYKFHSFTLELLAGLATWYVLSAGLGLLMEATGMRQRPRQD